MIETSRQWPQSGDLKTPFDKARREWDTRMGGAIVHARNWRLAAFASIAVAGLSIIGTIYMAQLPRIVPHIVEVDATGIAEYRGPVGKAWEDYKPSDAITQYYVERFVEKTRSISSDLALTKQRWIEAYNFVAKSAVVHLSEYARNNDPFKAAAENRITVDFLSVMRLTPTSWQVDWRENRWPKTGGLPTPELWRGVFQIDFAPSSDPKVLSNNPIGLQINEFSWTRIKS